MDKIMSFSIITCSFNPNDLIFNRLIEAIALLETDGLDVEWIVVDNNSTNKLENTFDFSKVKINLEHVSEIKPDCERRLVNLF
jgi:glycosyltransferase involved in cell wall biosynthesis